MFDRSRILTGSPEDAAAIVLLLALVGCVAQRYRHDGVAARWWRGGAYFAGCLLTGWGSGVLSRLARTPVATSTQLADGTWRLATLGLVAVVLIGYGGIWRAGTENHGRALHVPSVLAFGAAWGVSEGVLMLAFWAVGEAAGFGKVGASIAAILVASAWLGGWHATYWDRYVAPEHNIDSWNLAKVLFAHTPNLIVSLWYFAVHGNAVIFVSVQMVAIVICTWFMRFPRYELQAELVQTSR